jgi:5-methylcytosine-specific restriction endonuclease McrA
MDSQQHRVFMTRSANIYRHQQRRARKPLSYTLADLRQWLQAACGQPCGWCQEAVKSKSMSVDHAVPVSRGGGWDEANLIVCCERCNQIKGKLTEAEFGALLQTVASWPAEARSDVFARLRAGGRIIRG